MEEKIMFTSPTKRTPHKLTTKFSERKRRIYGFLRAHPVGVLSTVTTDITPHGVVIYFVIDEEFGISFLTRANTRKYENLKHNNQVMLTVFDPGSQTTAQVRGMAFEIVESYEVNRVAGAILAASLKTSDVGIPPISKLEAGPYVAVKILPEQIRMAIYARPDPGDYIDLFESIESYNLNDDVY